MLHFRYSLPNSGFRNSLNLTLMASLWLMIHLLMGELKPMLHCYCQLMAELKPMLHRYYLLKAELKLKIHYHQSTDV
jgi:hypothetical protein